MSLPVRETVVVSPRPAAVTGRTVIFRRRGIIASLLVTGFLAWWTRRQLARIARQYRRQPPQELPDYLRSDIGLPPALPRREAPPPWEQHHWR